MKTLNLSLSVILLAAPLLLPAQTSPPAHRAPAGNTGSEDATCAMVVLGGAPLSTYTRTKPAHGQKIDFSSTTVKSYRALLASQRNAFKNWLQNNAPKARITGQFDISLNAVAVELNGTSLATLMR